MDANSVADYLGVSPLYKQQANRRWNSAVALYQQSLEVCGQPSPSFLMAEGNGSRAASEAGGFVCDSGGASPTATGPRFRARDHPPIPIGHNHSAAGLLLSPDSLSRSMVPGASLPMGRNGLFFMGGGMTPPTRGGMWSGQLSRASLSGSNASPADRPGGGSLELEAVAAVHELSFAVTGISVSEMLPRTPDLIFVNVTTLEGQAYCLELTGKGWRVTSLRHDCMNGDINHIDLHTRYFESPYALMDTVSPGYRAKFSEALSYKLSQLTAQLPLPPNNSEPSHPNMEPPQQLRESATDPGNLVPKFSASTPSASCADLLRPDVGPVRVAVRHPSGEANQSFPEIPDHAPKR